MAWLSDHPQLEVLVALDQCLAVASLAMTPDWVLVEVVHTLTCSQLCSCALPPDNTWGPVDSYELRHTRKWVAC